MPAIGDELLGALDDEILAVGIQARLRQIEMRTGALLGQRQGGDMPARGNFLQVVLALMVGGLGGDHRSGHAMHAIAQGRGRTGTGNGFGEHAQAQQPLTQPALIHRNLQAEQAGLGERAHGMGRPATLGVDLGGQGRDDIFCQIGGDALQFDQLNGEQMVHESSWNLGEAGIHPAEYLTVLVGSCSNAAAPCGERHVRLAVIVA